MSEILAFDNGSVFDRVPLQGNDGARFGNNALFNPVLMKEILDVTTSDEIDESHHTLVAELIQEYRHYDEEFPLKSLSQLLTALGMEILVKYIPDKSIINFMKIKDYEDDFSDNSANN